MGRKSIVNTLYKLSVRAQLFLTLLPHHGYPIDEGWIHLRRFATVSLLPWGQFRWFLIESVGVDARLYGVEGVTLSY